jgi:folate-binding protein YgfZ
MTDLYVELAASLPAAASRCPAPFGLLALHGPDAVDFAQRLCSQDIAGLEPGRCAPGAFLDPKGKLVTTAVFARDGADVLIEVGAAQLEVVAQLLDRYHFTESLSIEALGGGCAELRGPGALAEVGLEAGTRESLDGGVQRWSQLRNGVGTVRWHGDPAAVADASAAYAGADDAVFELWRIAALEPRIGVDTEPTTLALEAALDDHVSTTKGCYTGQEIVARIHTYGHVNRKLVRLLIDTADPIERETSICDADDGSPLGRVMSAVTLPDGRRALALGYLPELFLSEPEPIALGTADGPRIQVVDGSFEPA